MKKNNSGITLTSLIITIIVLLILASIAVYSGIETVRSSKLTKFTTEMKIMQLKVNDLYDSYTNNRSVKVGETEYVGKGQEASEGVEAKPGVQEIGKDLSAAPQDKLSEASSGSGIDITTENGYRYYDIATINSLEIEGVEGEFFISVPNRQVISLDGFEYDGEKYYTLEQLPDGLYNVEYNPINDTPTFDATYEQIGDNKWKITISNIQYDGYISKWDVRYQKDGQSYWSTSEELTFEVNEAGLYKIYIEKGDVRSAETSKALGVPEPTPEVAEGLRELSPMQYGVIEVEFLDETSYNTTDTANAPILKEGMKAVYWGNTSGDIDETMTNNVTEIDSSNTAYKEANWYNYESQDSTTEDGGTSRWANAIVTVDNVDSYFVWIPRYAYRIIYFTEETYENQYRAGDITEEEALENGWIVGYSDARGIVNAEGKRPTDVSSQTAISVNDKYFKTHPAFDGDVNYGGWAEDDGTPVKLEGIWVAKYEAARSDTVGTTQGTSVIPKFVPGVETWRSITIGNMFTYSQEYNTNLNSHLMKNSEWGAVAYLIESKYGRNGTEVTAPQEDEYDTGGGTETAYIKNTNQSSTGNIYGIYGLSGGASEGVAGYYNETDANLDNGNSFATTNKSSDAYSTAYSTEYEKITNRSYKYGDATYETISWNDDENSFVDSTDPFFSRGGGISWSTSSKGIYFFNDFDGRGIFDGFGFRVCLTVK